MSILFLINFWEYILKEKFSLSLSFDGDIAAQKTIDISKYCAIIYSANEKMQKLSR